VRRGVEMKWRRGDERRLVEIRGDEMRGEVMR
jgi:hypothetical protein